MLQILCQDVTHAAVMMLDNETEKWAETFANLHVYILHVAFCSYANILIQIQTVYLLDSETGAVHRCHSVLLLSTKIWRNEIHPFFFTFLKILPIFLGKWDLFLISRLNSNKNNRREIIEKSSAALLCSDFVVNIVAPFRNC